MNKDQQGRLTACLTVISLIATSARTVNAQVITLPPECPVGRVSVLPNYISYAPYGSMFILVEFCNGTNDPIQQPRSTVRFLDTNGQTLEMISGPNYPGSYSNYAPGARWCDSYYLAVKPVGVINFVFDPPTFKVLGHTQAPLSLLDISANITDTVPTITGRIRNDHAASIRQVDLRAAIYDSRGRVVGCGSLKINSQDLAAHQSTSFQSTFPYYVEYTDPLYADATSYHIWADADTLDKLPIHLPQVVRQIAPTPTRTPVPTPVITLGPPSLVGNRNILRINANPVNSGGTIYATWSIPNFRDGEIDKGDGAGFKGPIAGTMTVDVPNVTASRYLTLRWRDTSGQELEDKLIVYVSSQNGPTPTSANLRECSSSDPNWRGSNPAYTFCVGKELNWTDSGEAVRNFAQGADYTLTAAWDVYGIAGIWFIVEPSGQVCAPAGTSVINRQTVGMGQESFNVRDLAGGGYKVYLRIKRSSDGIEVDYNERYLCVGNSPATLTPPATTATIWPTALP